MQDEAASSGGEVLASYPDLFKIINESSYSNGEGDGTPLQYSCLENPMDGGAWKAVVHGVHSCGPRLWGSLRVGHD